jgi:hypothetical protein
VLLETCVSLEGSWETFWKLDMDGRCCLTGLTVLWPAPPLCRFQGHDVVSTTRGIIVRSSGINKSVLDLHGLLGW